MEYDKILLVGARKRILSGLKEELQKEGFNVEATGKAKKVVDDYWDEKFALIAFGRAISDLEKDKIKGVFSTKNKDTIFVEGMAPIVPLLVYQIKSEIYRSGESRCLNDFKIEQGKEIKLDLDLKEKCNVKIVQYYLDFWYKTHSYYFLNSELNSGKYSITVEKKRNKAFLVVDVNGEEIHILAL